MAAFLALRKDAIFNATDGEGRLFHVLTGECFALDRIATILLQASLEASSKEEVLALLHLQLEASNQQLEEGLDTMRRQLFAWNLLALEGECLSAVSSFPHKSDHKAYRVADGWCSECVAFQKYPQGDRLDWEVFLTGVRQNTPLPHLSPGQRLYAFWKTFTLLLLFLSSQCATVLCRFVCLPHQIPRVQAHQWRMLCTALATPLGSGSAVWLEEKRETQVRAARRELVYCQCLTRVMAPSARCLVRSVAFTRYLRALGLDAHLVIGRERFDVPEDVAFHAWVELAGQVVNDMEELQTGYAVFYRVPAEPAPGTFLPEI
jgi:hypothetical protein